MEWVVTQWHGFLCCLSREHHLREPKLEDDETQTVDITDEIVDCDFGEVKAMQIHVVHLGWHVHGGAFQIQCLESLA